MDVITLSIAACTAVWLFRSISKDLRDKERLREQRMLEVLAHAEAYVGQDEAKLFEALGTPSQSCGLDFGLVSHCWETRNVRVCAYTRNGRCEALGD